MSNQLELAVEERAVSGKKVKRLRWQGIVPANMYGHNLRSVSLQVNNTVLQKLLARGGKNVILSLKVGDKPAVQALIKQVQRNPLSGETVHVDFYQVAATETLKTNVRLHFVNELSANLDGGNLLRSLSEVMVECLPGDLPSSIQVDLSELREVGAVMRVGNLKVDPAVTILTDPNDIVAGIQQQARIVKTEEAEGKVEGAAAQAGIPLQP